MPVGGELTWRLDPEWIDWRRRGWRPRDTYVSFEGRTAYGERSEIPFHVTSTDWQESDRVLAGIMTAFGAPTTAVAVGGYGQFDGTMRLAFRRPRIDGRFTRPAPARLGRRLGHGRPATWSSRTATSR